MELPKQTQNIERNVSTIEPGASVTAQCCGRNMEIAFIFNITR